MLSDMIVVAKPTPCKKASCPRASHTFSCLDNSGESMNEESSCTIHQKLHGFITKRKGLEDEMEAQLQTLTTQISSLTTSQEQQSKIVNERQAVLSMQPSVELMEASNGHLARHLILGRLSEKLDVSDLAISVECVHEDACNTHVCYCSAETLPR